MKRKLIIIFILTFLLSKENKAQANFEKGYILTSERDTIFGEIDNKDYHSNSQFCDFKRNNSDSIIRFYPDRIYGYRFINGKFYISRNIKIENKNLVVFMEFLIHGQLDIYFYQDENDNNHYYASRDTSSLQELKYSEGIKEIGGKKMFYRSKQFIGVLRSCTSDCPEINDKIPKLGEPNHKNLINFAENYHNLTCKDKSCIIFEKKISHKVKLNISTGSVYYFKTIIEDSQSNTAYLVYGFDLLFQQTQRNEKFYWGLGFYKESEGYYRIPLSFYYLNPARGFSPVACYEFDLNEGGELQRAKFGFKYQMKKISFSVVEELVTVMIVSPRGSAIKFGIMYDLR